MRPPPPVFPHVAVADGHVKGFINNTVNFAAFSP